MKGVQPELAPEAGRNSRVRRDAARSTLGGKRQTGVFFTPLWCLIHVRRNHDDSQYKQRKKESWHRFRRWRADSCDRIAGSQYHKGFVVLVCIGFIPLFGDSYTSAWVFAVRSVEAALDMALH